MHTSSRTQETPSPWRQAWDESACDHEGMVTLTVFTASNATRHYRHQCSRCGDNLGAVKKIDVSPRLEPSLPAFDQGLRDRWMEAVRSREQEIREGARREDKEEFDAWYKGDYLRSAAWQAMRRKIFARAKGVCEGCGERGPAEVHHLTYKHVGREFMWELAAVCRECHERIHDAQTEPEY